MTIQDKITFLGACGTVTGSKYLLDINSKKILIDCGFYQGEGITRQLNLEFLDYLDPSQLDAVIITHAHADHIGLLPLLYKHSYRGKVFLTEMTGLLGKLILEDSLKIMKQEEKQKNPNSSSKKSAFHAIYEQRDLDNCLNSFVFKKFNDSFNIDSVAVEFFSAGHIPGACCVLFKSDRKTILFSGDLGRNESVLVPAPSEPPKSDFIICESTYGSRLHPDKDLIKNEIKELCQPRKKQIFIPAFAMARSQELLFYLNEYAPKQFDIYYDTPMGRKIWGLFKSHADQILLSKKQMEKIEKRVEFIEESWQRESMIKSKNHKIVVTTSGMLDGGPIVQYLELFLDDPSSFFYLPGFLAEGTRGAHEIAAKTPHFRQSHLFSAHADQTELSKWLISASHGETKIFLTHGQDDAREALKKHLSIKNVICPSKYESVNLEL